MVESVNYRELNINDIYVIYNNACICYYIYNIYIIYTLDIYLHRCYHRYNI